jgi:uncharacterized membrane protein YbhN (UPF0104 family)
VRAGCGMSGVKEEPVLAAPGRDAALTAAVVVLTAVVFALVAGHGILARIQHVDDAWLRLMVSSRSAPVTAVAKFLNLLGLVYVTLPVRIAIAGVAAVGVNALAGFGVHAALLVIFFSWAGRSTAKAFKLPSSSTLLVILAVVAAVIGIVVATRQGRRFAARKLLPSVRSSLASLGRMARSPARLALLFGGSALVTLAYIGGLVASVEAFGGGAGIAAVGAVYLAASLVAAASPTPGGIGAFETAAAAGLTGLGISSGAAVSAVLTYRLATYWLPVLPGWLCWHLLQRMDYV